MSSLINLPDRLVYACDDFRLYAPLFWLHLLVVFRIILHEAYLFFVLQLGTGAKSKNLLELNRKYKGVSWRYSTVELYIAIYIYIYIMWHRACVTCHNRADVCRHSPAALVETRRWKASQHYQVSLCSLIIYSNKSSIFLQQPDHFSTRWRNQTVRDGCKFASKQMTNFLLFICRAAMCL